MPEITVVITCYNYGHYIEASLHSVLNQTYSDFHIVVIDDGSTDNTTEIMKRYESLPNINYIRQPNRGQANAKNAGIANARGNYIAFLDADDLWEKSKLEKQMALFASDTVGVVFSRASYIDVDGQTIDFQVSGKYLQPKRGRVTDDLLMDNFVPFSSSIVRKDCFERIGIFDESLKMGIDWDLWLKISTQYEFDFVDRPLLKYRLGHPGQMSKNREERQRCSDRIMNSFVNEFPNHVNHNILRRAWAYTYSNRGSYYADQNRMLALKYYGRSILRWPFSLRPFKGVLKVMLNKISK